MGEARGKVDVVPRFISFVAFLTTLVIYSPNVMVLQGIDANGYTGYFAEPCLLCSFLAALGVAAGSFRRAPIVERLCARSHTVGCALLYWAGAGGFALLLYAQPVCGAWVCPVLALCTSCSILPVCVAWARSLDGMSLNATIRLVAFAGICSALINLALSAMPRLVVTLSYLALLVCGLWYPVSRARRRHGRSEGRGSRADKGTSCLYAESTRIDLRAFLSVIGVSLLGMAISSFAMGVQPVFLFGNLVDAQRAGMVVGGMALLPLSFCNQKRPMASFVYQVYLPVAAAVVLFLSLFIGDESMHDVTVGAMYALYAMTSGIAVSVAIAVANADEFPRTFVCAALIGTFCGMGILGITLGARVNYLASNAPIVLIVLTAVYGTAMLVARCVQSWGLMLRPAPQPASEDAEGDNRYAFDGASAGHTSPTFDERVAALARDAGLSPRETQVMGYIGRGYSSVYVAKTLLISESTVHSHVRNMYRKLGVANREELIQMIDDGSMGEQ